MLKSSKQHLIDSKATYLEHMTFALKAGLSLLWAGIASLIHAFIPGLFKGTAAFTVINLYNQRLINHPNPIYQEKIYGRNNNPKDPK